MKTTHKEYHIVLSSNERYMPGATVALAGVALNAKPETALHFHVFTEDVRPETFEFLSATIKRLHPKSVVEQHVCDESILAGLPLWAGSRMSAVRIYYPRLLPNVNWALYVDCDILYLANIEKHFATADESTYACVSREMSESAPRAEKEWSQRKGMEFDAEGYFNAGVMLLNLKKMRDDKMPEKLAAFFRAHPDVRYPDQTAMNYCFGACGKKIVDQKFNWLQIYLDDAALAKRPVIHYVSGIPWLPKISAVANGRFRLWHAFADKYVWQKKGESYRRCFSWKVLMAKRAMYWILRTPVLGMGFAKLLARMHRVVNAQGWIRTQVGCDISDAAIGEVL